MAGKQPRKKDSVQPEPAIRTFTSVPKVLEGVTNGLISQLIESGDSSQEMGLIITFQQAKEMNPKVLEKCIGVTVVDNTGKTKNASKVDLERAERSKNGGTLQL